MVWCGVVWWCVIYLALMALFLSHPVLISIRGTARSAVCIPRLHQSALPPPWGHCNWEAAGLTCLTTTYQHYTTNTVILLTLLPHTNTTNTVILLTLLPHTNTTNTVILLTLPVKLNNTTNITKNANHQLTNNAMYTNKILPLQPSLLIL